MKPAIHAKGVVRAVLTLVIALIAPVAAMASRPTPPASVLFTKTAPLLGSDGTVRLDLTVDARVAGTYRLRVLASSSGPAPLATGLLLDRMVPLQAGGSFSQSVSLRPRSAGDIEVTAIVEPAGGGSSSDVRFVRIGEDGAAPTAYDPREYLALHGPEVARRRPGFGLQPQHAAPRNGAGPKPLLGQLTTGRELVGGGTLAAHAGPTRGRTLAASGGSSPLTLSGRVVAQVNGTTIPMRNTELQVWDSDTFSPDDQLGTVTTDDQGRYAITVTNDDGAFGGGVDVYLYVSAKRATVAELYIISDGQGGTDAIYYAWRSPTVDNITARSYVMDFTITDQPGAASVWSGVSRAQWLQTTYGGHGADYVEVRYPGLTSGTYFRNNLINIDYAWNSPETSGHEYGHAILHQAYGSNPGPGGPHQYCDANDQGLAWSEGFATFIGLSAGERSGVDHWVAGDEGVPIERYSCGLRSMAVDEGRVAAALWDLWDAPTDGNGGDPNLGASGFADANQGTQLVDYGQLLSTLWVRHQGSVGDYWTDLNSRLRAEQQPPSLAIMNYNYRP